MARLYLDEDQDPLVARRLRERGHDVVSAHDVGMEGASDSEQLSFATSAGRTLITFNIKDFAPLHWELMGESRQHAGIVVSRQYQRREIGELVRLLESLLHWATDNDLANRMRFLG